MLRVWWVCTYFKIHQDVYIKYVQFFYVSNASVKKLFTLVPWRYIHIHADACLLNAKLRADIDPGGLNFSAGCKVIR